MTKIYTAYDPPPNVSIGDWGPSMTRQADADGCDINKIVSRYKTTGVLPAAKDAAIYADVSEMGDYRTAVEQVRIADALFMQLPSNIRTQFSNNPSEFLDFVSDPENHEKMQEMGLVKKAPPQEEPKPIEMPPGDPPEEL